MKRVAISTVLAVFILGMFFLTRCTSLRDTLSFTLTQSHTPTATQIPTETATISPTNTATQTITRSPTNTPTPLPTFSPKDSQIKFAEWLQGSEECRMPCWAGITPGETTWEEARWMIESVLRVSGIVENHEYLGDVFSGFSWGFPYAYHEHVVYGEILEENSDTVTYISARIGTSEYQMPIDQIFLEYGLPEKILIRAAYYPIDDYADHWIILSYPNYNFVIRYMRLAWRHGEGFWSCGGVNYTDLRIDYELDPVWDDNAILTMIGERYLTESGYELFPRVDSLEDVTEFTIESFVELFLKDSSACFEISIEN